MQGAEHGLTWVSYDTIIKGTPAQVNLLEGWGLGRRIKSPAFTQPLFAGALFLSLR